MWLSEKLVTLFEISRDTVQDLKTEVATLKALNAQLQADLTSTRITSDWLRHKINDLEAQNKGLLEKAYNVKLPIPVIERAAPTPNPYKLPLALFEHIDEDTAKALGAENVG